jgi:hypothetical protein
LALIATMVAGMLAIAASAPARAQDNGPEIETLMEFPLEDAELPLAPSRVRLLRITVEPGAKSPLHMHPGPEFNLIEEGTFRVLVQGKAPYMQEPGDGTPVAGLTQAPDGEFIMRSGDIVGYMPGTALTFRNSGSKDAVMMAVVILPWGNQHPPGLVWIGQSPSEEELAGVFSQPLGDGFATYLPDGPAVMRLERITLRPGEPIPAFSGPVLLSLEEGSFDFEVTSGAVQVSRTLEGVPQPEAAPGTSFSLAVADAAYFPNGMAEAPRSDNDGELTLLRLTIASTDSAAIATPVAESQGAITIAEPPAPSPTPEPTATPTAAATAQAEAVIEPGATVVVTEDDVRLRSGPTTDSEILGAANQGQVFVITGPSQEGSGYTWWPVEDPNNPAFAGFIAEDFIELQAEE